MTNSAAAIGAGSTKRQAKAATYSSRVTASAPSYQCANRTVASGLPNENQPAMHSSAAMGAIAVSSVTRHPPQQRAHRPAGEAVDGGGELGQFLVHVEIGVVVDPVRRAFAPCAQHRHHGVLLRGVRVVALCAQVIDNLVERDASLFKRAHPLLGEGVEGDGDGSHEGA